RVMVSKILLLAVAFAAAWVAARKPADILFMVSAAFSFAASSFFPALVMGIFWRRANKWGATFGMLAGLAATFAYMSHTHPWMREWVLGVERSQPVELWWGIQPIAAGVFGAPVAFLTIIVVSLLTPPPGRATAMLVPYPREPEGRPRAAQCSVPRGRRQPAHPHHAGGGEPQAQQRRRGQVLFETQPAQQGAPHNAYPCRHGIGYAYGDVAQRQGKEVKRG